MFFSIVYFLLFSLVFDQGCKTKERLCEREGLHFKRDVFAMPLFSLLQTSKRIIIIVKFSTFLLEKMP